MKEHVELLQPRALIALEDLVFVQGVADREPLRAKLRVSL